MTLETLALALVDALWLGALGCAVAFAAPRLAPRANAATRFAVWLGALVVPPAAAVCVALAQQRRAGDGTTAFATSGGARGASALAATLLTAPSGGAHVTLPAAAIATAVLLWAAGVAFFACRIARDLGRLAYLVAHAAPLPPERRPALTGAGSRGSRIRFVCSDAIDVPLAVGFRGARVVLPRAWVEGGAGDDDLARAALHEAAHLARRDDWWSLAQHVACAVAFFSPFAWIAAGRLEIEREVACDDAVLRTSSDAEGYARFLTDVARSAARRRHAIAPAMFRSRRALAVRVERVLGVRRDIGATPQPAALAVAMALAVLGSAAGFAYAAPLSLGVAGASSPARTADARARAWLGALERGDVDGLPLGTGAARAARREALLGVSRSLRGFGPIVAVAPAGVTRERTVSLYHYRLAFRSRRLAYTYGENRSGGGNAIVIDDAP